MLDLGIVLAFVGYAAAQGFLARKKASQSLRQYFLAGQNVKGWKAGFSMAATQYAADTPLLVTGLVATAGVFALWRFWIYGLGYLLLAFIFAEMWRRSRVLTDAELTELRYDGRGVLFLRGLKAIYYGTIVNCIFLAMVLVAAVRIAEVFMPWHTWLPADLYAPILGLVQSTGLVLSSSVTGLDPAVVTTNGLISLALMVGFAFLYSATGGMRSVVNTDAMQFVLAMLGTVVYSWYVVDAVGGIGALGPRIVELYGQLQGQEMMSFAPSGTALFPFLMVIALQGLFWVSSDGTGYLAQRAMSTQSDHDARVAGAVFSWSQILVRSLIWLVISAGLLVLYPFDPSQIGTDGFAAAREMTFVTGIDDLLPVGLRGLMLTGLLAALTSTIDTHLNWGASYWSNDLYKRLICEEWLDREPSGSESVLVARLSNVVVLAFAIGIMVSLGSIQATWFISLVFGAGIGPVLMLRWLWERVNLYAEGSAIVASLIAAPIVINVVDAEWLRLLSMVVASLTATVITALVTPPTSPEARNRFYERVRPFGWWPRSAKEAGDAPMEPTRALGRRLRLTLLSTASLFGMLVGIGKLLVHPPGANLFWPTALLVGAVALVPFWWRDLQAAPDRSRVPEEAPVDAAS
ncbi:MAG: sodium transporter [Bacteroidetes bacterium]|jgi:Na+/proline symporter|nr:sodium transporter [Bacteroidota bacterium]